MIKAFSPDLDAEDIQSVLSTLEQKALGFGPNVPLFEDQYKRFSKKKENIAFNSASSAAYLLFQYLYETHGSCRVYTTSLGFVSPVFAAVKNGHEVIYVDVDDNLLFSIDDLEAKYIEDERKSIVVPVLYGGVSFVPGIDDFCKRKQATLVLDSAHCISPSMDYDYAFYSFHPVKPICMSNGGLLSTDKKEPAEYFRKGRNFGRQVIGDTYDIVQNGFNFYMNNLNAALGLSQLKKCENNVRKRCHNFQFLKNNIPSEIGHFSHHDEHSSYYLSTLILNKGFSSAILRKYLSEAGIQSSFHYPFLHKTSQYAGTTILPKLESLDDKIINLPIHQDLTTEDLNKIANECIYNCRSRSKPQ